MSFVKKNISWLIVFLAVAINAIHYLNIFVPMGISHTLNIFDNVIFGKDLVDKLFLPIVAWIVFGFWLVSRKTLAKFLKNNYKAILLIFLFLLLSRILSFGRWFYQEDFQLFDNYFSRVPALPFARYSVGLFALSIIVFGSHFWLFNVLGLVIFGLVGVAVYAFLNKLNIDKKVSLLAVLFLITSPTYFHQTTRYLAFIGQPFTLLMFIVACYFLIIRFYPGSLIFMAATLQHGLDVSALTPVSLLLIALIYIERKYKRKLDYKIFLFFILLLPLVYKGFLSVSFLGKSNPLGLHSLLAYTNLIFGVTVPPIFAFSIITFLRWMLRGFAFLYLSPILGASILLIMVFLIVKFYFSKKYEIAKILLLGFTILAVTNIVISKVSYHSPQNLNYMTLNFLDALPSGVTTYGLFPTLGLCLVIAALGQASKGSLFKKIIITVVLIDIFSFIHADREFIKVDSVVQRKIDSQLQTIISDNNLTKIVYVPDISSQGIFRRKFLNFVTMFRNGLKKTIWLADDSKTLMLLKDKYQVSSDQIYFLLIDSYNNQIYNFSWMLQKYKPQEALLQFSNICKNKDFEDLNLKQICQ